MANNENDNDAAQVYLLGKTSLANNQGQFFIRNDPIIHMAAGDQHTIIVTQTGRAFAFGDNSSGQLGLGHTNKVEKVSCIKSLKFGDTGERVVLAACGRDASLVATNRGALYAFGSNGRNQLGIDSSESKPIYSEPVKIEHFRGKISWKQIAMGAEHACALTEDGQVYIWGSNEDGQCGQPRKQETVKAPRELRVEDQVNYISCGYYHTALVTADGRLFVFGNNDDRQLGRSMPDKHAGPLEVSLPNKVKAVACGHQHTVVLTDKGEVFTCGLGDRGQLGLGLRVLSAETFESVQNLPKRLVAIAAGEAHTVVLSARGGMYVFGDGKHGKLGPTTHSNEFEPCLVDKFKSYNVTKVVCGGCQTIVLAEKKKSDDKKSSESEEDIGNATLSATQKPKSRARNDRIKNLTDRSQTINSSIDTKIQHARPLGASSQLRTESDGDESNKELSESLKSATFNQTHTIANGKFRPTQSTSLNRTSLRSNDDELRPLKTGALDRTVRLNKDSDDLTKTNNRFPPIEKSPSRNTRFDRSDSPSNIKRRQDSDDDDDDKSPLRNNKPNRTNSPQITRKRQDSDDDKPPVRNARFESSKPSQSIRKKSDSDDDRSPLRNTKFDRTNPPQNIRKKRDSDDEKSSSEEQQAKSFNKKSEPSSLSARNETKNSPISKRKDDSDSDDNKRRRPSPIKAPMSENLNRKSRERAPSDDEEEEDDDDDDNDDDDRSSSHRNKQKQPPTVTRRSSLPSQTRPGAVNSSSRDGNQTIGSRPVDGVRGSMRGPATKTLAKPTTNTDSTKKEAPPAEQPGFFARLFGIKSTPPPPPPPPKPAPAPPAAEPATNTNSRACSIM